MKGRPEVVAILLTAIFILGSIPGFGGDLPWPLSPESPSHGVSYFYGNQQDMTFPDFSIKHCFHVGMDIPGAEAQIVYAVESGYVKAKFTIFGADTHWRIVIADSAGTGECDGWLYAHIMQASIPVSVGDYVNAGDPIGVLVSWPSGEPIHLHLSRVRFAGDSAAWANGFWDYKWIANPLLFLAGAGDTISPSMGDALYNGLFAICANETDSYFDVGDDISGDVDIVGCAYDYCASGKDTTNPYKIEYRIEGDSSIPWTTSFDFGGSIDSYNGEVDELSHVVYKYDNTCNSTTYPGHNYYFILTNTDGDAILEVDDKNYSWQTPYFHNGEYKILARASDFDGNSYMDSMTVTVRNIHSLTGTVGLEGMSSNLQGTKITVLPDNLTGFTVSGGAYSLPEVGGGYQTVSISRLGYITFDTLLLFDRNHQIDVTLNYVDYTCGDADASGGVNILDVSFVISYLYKGGPMPAPPMRADVDHSGAINILDVGYTINYLYKSGPAPNCP